jgi:hypothetical protein
MFPVFRGSRTWPFTLREEYLLHVFGNKGDEQSRIDKNVSKILLMMMVFFRDFRAV